MSKIFISHSSANNAQALAIAQWLLENGWNDYFLDIAPSQGLTPGEKWQEALKKAADRCEAVLFLITPAWRDSKWCSAEFLLARQLGKRILGLLVEPTPLHSLPKEIMSEWQIANLVEGSKRKVFQVHHDPLVPQTDISFSEPGLSGLKQGLQKAGLDPTSFPWPPKHDLMRAPYRGLKALEAEDAAIFFGRDAAIVRGLDEIRLMREQGVERLFVILGASGAGKSSFLRAGLWPRLERDDRYFLPLPVIRPGRNVITGPTGLVASLEGAFERFDEKRNRADLRQVVQQPDGLSRTMVELQVLAQRRSAAQEPPTIVLSVDQGEELFTVEGREESCRFLAIVGNALSPPIGTVESAIAARKRVIALIAIRSDFYEDLQTSKPLSSVKHNPFNLKPLAREEFKAVIEEPARLLARGLKIDHKLTEQLLHDAEGADALPLLAFTLERLYLDYGMDGDLRLDEYHALGGVRGSVEAVVDLALGRSENITNIASDKSIRDKLLRRTFIPWLAGIDPETGSPKRRVASRDELPTEAQPLLDCLVQARLLIQDQRVDEMKKSVTGVVEIAHEALLRQWPTLTAWLDDDRDLLKTTETVRRAASEWVKNGCVDEWLDHRGERLKTAEEVGQRSDLWELLGRQGQSYVKECRRKEDDARAERKAQLKQIEEEQKRVALAQQHTARFQRISSLLLVAVTMLLMAGGAWTVYQAREVALQRSLVLATNAKTANDAGRHDEALRLAMLGAHPGLFVSASVEIEPQLARGAYSSTMHAQFVGHEGPVSVATFSPDGTKVVTASWDNTARLWDVESGKELAKYPHNSKVNSAVFSPDGTRLVTSGLDTTVVLWEVSTGKVVSTMFGHRDSVYVSGFTRDGAKVLTTSLDKTARVWDASTGKELAILRGHEDRVYSAAFSPDDSKILSSSWDRTARLWDVATGKQIAVLRGHQDRLFSAKFSRDGSKIVTASRDKTARVWNTATIQELAKLIGHEESVFSATFIPDGTKVLTASSDETARLWNASTGKHLTTLVGHKGEVKSAVFSPDGTAVLTASTDDTARLWNAVTGKEIVAYVGHRGMVRSAAFNSAGTQVVTASRDKTARVWDVPVGMEAAQYRHDVPVSSAAFSPDGTKVVTAASDHTARLWDVATNKEMARFIGHEGSVEWAVFNPTGTRIVTASRDKTAVVWDVFTHRVVRKLVGHDATVNSVAFNHDGTMVVTASGDLDTSDYTARVWDLATGREVAKLVGHEDRVYSAEFSPDGTKIMTTSWDGTARLWSLATNAEIMRYRHEGRVNSCRFSSDGNFVVTASSDHIATVWDTMSGRDLTKLVGHDGIVNFAEFSPDGTKIVTASSDQTTRIWEITTGKELAKLVGHNDSVYSAFFSSDGSKIVTASSDGTARLWEAKWLTEYRGKALTERVCREKLIGARHLTKKDTEISSILVKREGEDVCDPPSFLSRLAKWIGSTSPLPK